MQLAVFTILQFGIYCTGILRWNLQNVPIGDIVLAMLREESWTPVHVEVLCPCTWSAHESGNEQTSTVYTTAIIASKYSHGFTDGGSTSIASPSSLVSPAAVRASLRRRFRSRDLADRDLFGGCSGS